MTETTHSERLARARLSLEGLATGDAFGQRFFVNPATVEGLIANRALAAAPWGFTDDTVMAISIVETLAEERGIDQDALAEAFGRRYLKDPARGYGPGAHRILGAIARGESWDSAAGRAFSGQGSYGNGGAMRAAPIGAYFAEDPERAAEEAARSAQVTHAHPEGQAGAVAVAVAAAVAWELKGEWEAGELLGRVADLTPAGETQAGLLQAAAFPPTFSVASASSLLGNGSLISSADTVPFCVWVLARFAREPWEEVLWQTVSALGDRDTTCAIVGSILVLAQGLESIPPAWRSAREPYSSF